MLSKLMRTSDRLLYWIASESKWPLYGYSMCILVGDRTCTMPDLISISFGGRIAAEREGESGGGAEPFALGCCTSPPVLCGELASDGDGEKFVREPSAFARLYCTASVANER